MNRQSSLILRIRDGQVDLLYLLGIYLVVNTENSYDLMWVKTGSCPLDALYRNLFSASLNGHVGHSFAWSTSTKRGKLEKIVLLKEFTIQKYTPWLC